jgi:hypothetical protein
LLCNHMQAPFEARIPNEWWSAWLSINNSYSMWICPQGMQLEAGFGLCRDAT